MSARVMLALLAPWFAVAQPVSVGVEAGAPVSAHSQDFGQGCFDRGPAICGPNAFFSKPYAIGPVIHVNLPANVSVQLGFLYKRFHRDVAHGLTAPHGGPVSFGEKYSVSANGWLFPLLLRYSFGRRRVAPFVDAGATLRHTGAFEGQGIQVDFFLQPQAAPVRIESGRGLDAAVTLGGGVRWRAGAIDVAPEVRFLHWTSAYYQPARNEAMLMLGITFPARSK